MVKKVSVVITDDLDGSAGAETITFALDKERYEIDLGPANRTRFADALAPFISASRRVGRGPGRSTGRTAAQRADRAAVREWARDAGLAVSERGRISSAVIRQYEAAH